MNREDWLSQLALRMAPRFEALGYPLPAVRMAVGFTSRGAGSAAIGECWSAKSSADQVHEIFIRPDQVEPMSVAATLAHELAHSAVGLAAGHTGKFAQVALALGLKRPMTATSAGPDFIRWVEPMLADLPPLPHGKLSWPGPGVTKIIGLLDDFRPGVDADKGSEGDDLIISSSGPKKQGTRMHKVTCSQCGYVARVSQKWLDIGPPHCPKHGAMVADKADDGKD